MMFKQTKDILTKHKVGRWTYGVPEIKYDNKGGNLEIGAFCSIAGGVQILLGGNHRMDWVTTYPFYLYWDSARYIPSPSHAKGDVIIKNDVWIGENATILSGVTIGNGAVIGTSAVVAKNVPDYSVVVGNPAKVIRKRFDEETIERLLRISWWNWSDQKIETFLPLMLDTDISKFLIAHVIRGKNVELTVYYMEKLLERGFFQLWLILWCKKPTLAHNLIQRELCCIFFDFSNILLTRRTYKNVVELHLLGL